MRYSIAPLALAALAAAKPMPQGVTSAIAPSASAPAGCSPNYSGSFQIQVVNVTSSAGSKVKRQADGTLIMTLSGGVLKDSKGRTGYIAANQQFQFDGPPQTGAIYTAGWSVCQNSSLAIGNDAIFYQCLSGTFYNLYDEATAAQCSPVYIEAIGAGSGSGAASQTGDGQVTASPVSSGAASQLSDGQVTASPVSQISDGQVQATTGAPVTQISDGQVQATSAAAVSQISDGQVQATTAAAVSQISDGQVQATTAAAVSQISDGQVQATTAAAVSQISDGQVQATTGAPVTQISDGQIQASTAAAPVTQISDGQIQAPTGSNSTVASPTASVVPYTGAAAPTAIRGELFGLAVGVLAIAML